MKYVANWKVRHDGKLYKKGEVIEVEKALPDHVVKSGAVSVEGEGASTGGEGGEEKSVDKMTVPELEAYAKEKHGIEDLEAKAKEILEVEKANKAELVKAVKQLDEEADAQ